MQIYNVNFQKLALMLLPNVLRKHIVFALLKSACQSLVTVKDSLDEYRDKVQVRISHTSQVCYITALLNETFLSEDSASSFAIEDTQAVSGEWIMTYEENYNISEYENVIPLVDTETPTIFYTEDAIREYVEDFIVFYPSESGIEPNNNQYIQMQALVEKYRLASKLPRYQLKTE